MTSALLLIVGGVLLYVGGEALVKGASRLALRVGLSPLAVGLTVVACGTSAPELIVCVQAAFGGHDDVAVGNVVGSNIANVGLILGVTALIRPIATKGRLLLVDVPLMIAAEIAAIACVRNGTVGRYEGIALAATLAVYIAANFVRAMRKPGDGADLEIVDIEEVAGKKASGSTPVDLVLIGVGIAALVFGGKWFVDGAIGIATSLGVPDAVVALTVVAFGTSLPELAASAVAAVRGKGDLAVGNVVGSNLFNSLGVLGVTAAVRPVASAGISTFDTTTMLALAIALWPMMASRRRLGRFEAGTLLLVYAGYVGFLFVK
ncbi:MAG: calcium/sodium antiporter [Planctomycetota bacterium]